MIKQIAASDNGVQPMDFVDENQYADVIEILGVIHKPSQNDVLMGRESGVQAHPGNQNYRKLILSNRDNYMSAPRDQKIKIAQKIVATIGSCNPPGRFLDRTDDSYIVTSQTKVLEKVMRALRERPYTSKEFLEHFCHESDEFPYAAQTALRLDKDPDILMRLVRKTRSHENAFETPHDAAHGGEDLTKPVCALLGYRYHSRYSKHELRTDTTIDSFPAYTCSENFHEKDHSEKQMRNSLDLFADQFSDSTDDDTTTSVAIFHQCRHYGLL